MEKSLKYIVPIILGFLIGLISQQFQNESILNWYPYLDKPHITPPKWIFPIAWGIIYITSGISIGLILNSFPYRRMELMSIWLIQLMLNFAWSILFFYFRNPLAGLIIILILDLVILWYIIRAYRVRKAASVFYFPYMVWLLFATYLNFYILLNN